MPLFASGQAEQEKWTLEQCISYGLQHNITVKKQALSMQTSSIERSKAQHSRLFDVSADANTYKYYGRSLNYENQYVNVNSTAADVRISASVPIFSGFRISNSIKKAELDYKAEGEVLNSISKDVALSISLDFLNTLLAKELYNVSLNQQKLSEEQLQKVQIKYNAGAVSKDILLESMAQLSADEATLTERKAIVTNNLLALAQKLNVENPWIFDIDVSDLATLNADLSVTSASDLYALAAKSWPTLAYSNLKYKSNEYAVKIAKGALYPSFGGFGSYSIGWNNQFTAEQNRNSGRESVGVGMSIPIFGKFNARNDVKLAQINLEQSRLAIDEAEKTLRENIQKSYAEAFSSKLKYEAAVKSTAASRASFEFAKEKFDLGAMSVYDFNLTRSNLVKAESNMLQQKYNYLFSAKVLDFYQGVPIRL